MLFLACVHGLEDKGAAGDLSGIKIERVLVEFQLDDDGARWQIRWYEGRSLDPPAALPSHQAERFKPADPAEVEGRGRARRIADNVDDDLIHSERRVTHAVGQELRGLLARDAKLKAHALLREGGQETLDIAGVPGVDRLAHGGFNGLRVFALGLDRDGGRADLDFAWPAAAIILAGGEQHQRSDERERQGEPGGRCHPCSRLVVRCGTARMRHAVLYGWREPKVKQRARLRRARSGARGTPQRLGRTSGGYWAGVAPLSMVKSAHMPSNACGVPSASGTKQNIT